MNKIVKTVDKLYSIWGGKGKSPLKLVFRGLHTALQISEIWKETSSEQFLKKKRLHVFNKMGKFFHMAAKGKIPSKIVFTEKSSEVLEYKIGNDRFCVIKYGIHMEDELYATCDNLDSFAKWLWKNFNNTCSFDLKRERWHYIPIPKPIRAEIGEYVGKYNEDVMSEYWKSYQKENKSRVLLFAGLPGTGKTTCCFRIAKKEGGSLLHFPSLVLSLGFDSGEIFDLVRFLKPDVVVMEDIHVLGKTTTSILLHLLENLNHNKELLLIATTNELSELDDCMKRPGRFDEVFEFEAPTDEERKEVLSFYATPNQNNCVDLLNSFLDDLVEETKGLTQAYLKELIEATKIASNNGLSKEKTKEKIIDRAQKMKKMLGVEEEEDDEDEDEEEKPKRKKTSKKLEKALTSRKKKKK